MNTEIQEYSKVAAALEELRLNYSTVPDVSTKQGYELCKKNAKEVAQYRIRLEKKRKEIKAPALERCKLIDSEAKRILCEIEKIENPLKEAYQKIDNEKKRKEQERINSIREKINAMSQFESMAAFAGSDEISEWIEQVDEIDCSQGFQELAEEALQTRNRVLDSLQMSFKMAVQREAQQKELEELRSQNAKLAKASEEKEASNAQIIDLNSTAPNVCEEKKETPRAVHDLCIMCALSSDQAFDVYQSIKDGLISGVKLDV